MGRNKGNHYHMYVYFKGCLFKKEPLHQKNSTLHRNFQLDFRIKCDIVSRSPGVERGHKKENHFNMCLNKTSRLILLR
jgi:hypothetical protein